jgi:SAM-dependent methyltransferase
VLDLACGMGRLTIPLAKAGMEMTGVDLTARYIRRARRRAEKERLRIRFIERDMREIDSQEEFHAVFNWFTSFGYFSDRDNLELCRNVHGALRPGGRFLIETLNKSWLLSHLLPETDNRIASVRVTQKHRWDERTQRMYSTWNFSKGKQRERHRITLRLFDGTDMRKLLGDAGFRDVTLYGGPRIGRLTRHSKRLIAVARKQG